MAGVQEPLLLRSLTFCPAAQTDAAPYSEVLAAYEKEGVQAVSGRWRSPSRGKRRMPKSLRMLDPQTDKTSPTVTPYDPARIRYNTIGGGQWANAGQWIEWRFYAPESGRYALAAHFKQSYKTDSASVREIRIDGERPLRKQKLDVSL